MRFVEHLGRATARGAGPLFCYAASSPVGPFLHIYVRIRAAELLGGCDIDLFSSVFVRKHELLTVPEPCCVPHKSQ